jgi:hypothetical protein
MIRESGAESLHRFQIMTTFTRFALVRRCFSTAVGWQEYSTFVDYADPITLAQAEINARNMDWKESMTIALAPIF